MVASVPTLMDNKTHLRAAGTPARLPASWRSAACAVRSASLPTYVYSRTLRRAVDGRRDLDATQRASQRHRATSTLIFSFHNMAPPALPYRRCAMRGSSLARVLPTRAGRWHGAAPARAPSSALRQRPPSSPRELYPPPYKHATCLLYRAGRRDRYAHRANGRRVSTTLKRRSSGWARISPLFALCCSTQRASISALNRLVQGQQWRGIVVDNARLLPSHQQTRALRRAALLCAPAI